MTAAALQKRADRKLQIASEQGKAVKLDELDIHPIVRDQGFRNTADNNRAHLQLIKYAMQHCSHEMRGLIWKLDRRRQLPSLIDTIWRWENVGDALADVGKSRVEILHAAAGGKCVCECQWPRAVCESFLANSIDVKQLCCDVHAALQAGRHERTPVIVAAGTRGGEGKSLFLKALYSVFGKEHVFISPEAGRFPLVDLPGTKVVFLDEWRFDDEILPFATQCQWFDGSIVKINRPQNEKGIVGHLQYDGTAPIFATFLSAAFSTLL